RLARAAAHERRAVELRLRHEIGRELGRNSISLAKHSNFLIDLRRPANAPLLGAEIADALRGPQARHERILAITVGESDFGGPTHRRATPVAFDGDVRGPMA